MPYILASGLGMIFIIMGLKQGKSLLSHKAKLKRKNNGVIKSIAKGSIENYYNSIAKTLLDIFPKVNVDQLIDRIVISQMAIFIALLIILRDPLPIMIFIICLNLILLLLVKVIKDKRSHDLEEVFSQFLVEMVNQVPLTPNIKNAINNIHTKLPAPLNKYIGQLALEINSTNDIAYSLEKFANNSDSIYIKATMTVLKEYEERGGQIVENLNLIMDMLDEEVESRRNKKGTVSGITIDTVMLTVGSFLALVGNLMINPVTKNIFFTTPSGRSLFTITLSLFVISVVFCFIQIYTQKK